MLYDGWLTRSECAITSNVFSSCQKYNANHYSHKFVTYADILTHLMSKTYKEL